MKLTHTTILQYRQNSKNDKLCMLKSFSSPLVNVKLKRIFMSLLLAVMRDWCATHYPNLFLITVRVQIITYIFKVFCAKYLFVEFVKLFKSCHKTNKIALHQNELNAQNSNRYITDVKNKTRDKDRKRKNSTMKENKQNEYSKRNYYAPLNKIDEFEGEQESLSTS